MTNRFTYYGFSHNDSLMSSRNYDEERLAFYSFTFGSFGSWFVIDNLHEDVVMMSKDFIGIEYIDALAFVEVAKRKALNSKRNVRAYELYAYELKDELEHDAMGLD